MLTRDFGHLRWTPRGMRAAVSCAMHALPFALKRAHFVSLKLLRQFTIPEDLTPARFDLLYVLHKTRYRRPFQCRVAEWLGVSRATICKMVRALRNLGIIELIVDPKKTHFRRIKLTRFGRKRFSRALKAIRRGRVEGAVRSAWSTAELSTKEVIQEIVELRSRVFRFSRGLDERIELYC